MAGWRIADLNFCIADGKAVFLDVPGDRYFALPEDFSRFAAGRLSHVAADADEIVSVVEALLPSSMVQRRPSLCMGTRPVSEDVANRDWTWRVWACLPALLARILFYKFLLRTERLGPTLQRIRPQPGLNESTERHAFRRLATIGAATALLKRHLPLTDQCLPIALAVAGQLRRHGQAAQLVVGVMARPFRAHSWVQIDGLLVTDRIEAVRNFTPILVL